MLRLNGYSTGAFGKWHETPPWETSVSGPFARWPTLQGFDKFYGFIGGETNQWSPTIFDGVTKVEPPSNSNDHFTTDMTNQAVAWVRFQQALTPGKPFFVYYAPGATHAPHHVHKAWADKYKGKFDQGWDKLSDNEKRLFTRQVEVYAGFAEQTDHEVGRLVSVIKDMGELDDTLFFYIAGDNGASAEGGMIGKVNVEVK